MQAIRRLSAATAAGLTAAVLAVFAWGTPAGAVETVKLPYKGIHLLGFQELAPGKTWRDGGFLLVHGTLAHGRMEIIAAIQGLLKEKGHSSLAVNLGFNVDDRQGMLDCKIDHTHLNTDPVGEIAAWVGWLKGQGATALTVLGHSRGGNQVARYQVAHPDPAVKRLVLVSPATWNSARVANEYKQRYQKPLERYINMAKDLAAKGKGDSLMKGVDFLYCPNATVSANAFLSYYVDDKKMDTPTLVGSIDIPVLVTAATADTFVPDIPERMKGRTTATVRLKIVEGADHFYRDLFAEDLVDAVVQFAGS